jgi:ribonucleoside-diphosphate reductase alpha chain
MGVHEWLIQRGYRYEINGELGSWLSVYRDESERAANEHCDRFYLSHPVAYRAIAPTGTIGILAGTTTGIEPLFAVAYKRRFLTDGTKWKYQFVVDGAAERMIDNYGVKPEDLESASDLAADPERRIKFQADVQDYVDMSISSTINLPTWGSELNNEGKVTEFASILSKYAPKLRGFTCYPDGSRGGQPITPISYHEAAAHKGVIYDEVDICDITGKGGSCGV